LFDKEDEVGKGTRSELEFEDEVEGAEGDARDTVGTGGTGS
jgi:hypothetical protein